MQYEIKNYSFMGAAKEDGLTAFTQNVIVKVGIVGQNYDGFCNQDVAKISFPATGLDANEIKDFIASAVTQYVATKYPNY